MTLQRMARENSPDTLSASQEFKEFLNTLSLQNVWTDHTWEGNSFKAKKDKRNFFVEYEEYRTEQPVGTYTFSRKGKLMYFLTPKQKLKRVLLLFAPILALIFVFLLFIGLPSMAMTMALAAAKLHSHFAILGSLLPYILCLISLVASVYVSTDSICCDVGKGFVSISVFSLFMVICIQFGSNIISLFSKA